MNNPTVLILVYFDLSKFFLFFLVSIPPSFYGNFHNSLDFHEITIKVIYFTKSDARNYLSINLAVLSHSECTVAPYRFVGSGQYARHFCIRLEPWVADIGNLREESRSRSFLSWNYSAARSSRSLHFVRRDSREKEQECGASARFSEEPNYNLDA